MCEGTLVGIVSTKSGKKTQHFKPGAKVHTCYNLSLPTNGENMVTQVPLLLIVPSPSWDVDNLLMLTMNDALWNVSQNWWINQAQYRSCHQSLKELSTESNLEMVCNQAHGGKCHRPWHMDSKLFCRML